MRTSVMGPGFVCHYSDVIMTTMAYQITRLTAVYSTVYSDANQRKHQSSASLAFVWGIHRDWWIPRPKGQLRGKCFYLMTSSCIQYSLLDWGCIVIDSCMVTLCGADCTAYMRERDSFLGVNNKRGKPGTVPVYDLGPKRILYPNLAKSRLPILYCLVIKSFWNFVQGASVVLSCFVQNIRTI